MKPKRITVISFESTFSIPGSINSPGTSDFVSKTSIFGNIFSDFLCLINSHEFANSIISNIRYECKIAMSLHYYSTNKSILEHVVAWDMSNL